MSYPINEHSEGIHPPLTSFDIHSRSILNERMKPKDPMSRHQDSITSLMASMHLSFISSFGDDSEPAICSRRNDDTELNKYFDFDESEERGDVAAKQLTALHLAQASLESALSHLNEVAASEDTRLSYADGVFWGSDSVDSFEITSRRVSKAAPRNNAGWEDECESDDRSVGNQDDLYMSYELPLR